MNLSYWQMFLKKNAKPLSYLPVSFQQILEHLKVADLNPSHVVSRRQITITNTPQTPAEPRTLI